MPTMRPYVVTMTCRRGTFALDVEALDQAHAVSEARKHFNRTRGLAAFTEKRTYRARLSILAEKRART